MENLAPGRRWRYEAAGLSALLLLQLFVLWSAARALTGGRFVYPLDDAYIHMAVAKNLVLHGTWGVTPAGFTSSTSSIAWPLLLAAAYAALGVGEAAPLALNVALALLTALWACRALRGAPGAIRWGALLGLWLAAPLVPLALMGMEHGLHVLTSLAFAGEVLEAFAAPRPRRRTWVGLAALAALVTATRYEGAFLVAAVCLALAVQRRLPGALAVGAAGALPIAGYGAVSLLHGWAFLPNSVLLKRVPLAPTAAGLLEVLRHAAEGLRGVPSLAVLGLGALLGLLALWRWSPGERAPRWLLLVFLATLLLHLLLARVGHYLRYEAYLVALGLHALAVALSRLARAGPLASRRLLPRWRAAAGAAALVLAVPLLVRAVTAHRTLPPASRNVADQQLQMVRFIQGWFPGEAVALNDIGAVAFFTDARVVDLWGLASLEVARAKREGRDDADFNARLVERAGARVALLYRAWYPQTLPASWTEVGSWRVRSAGAVGNEEVSAFATRPGDVAAVRAAFCAFAPSLPGSAVPDARACR